MRRSDAVRSAGVLLSVLFLAGPALGLAQEPVRPSTPAKPVTPAEPTESDAISSGPPARTFGSQIGAQFKTVTGTIPTFQLYMARPLGSAFRWGGLGFVSAGSDLREYALACTIGLRKGLGRTFAVAPYAGFGFLYATWDALGNSTFSDTSWAIYVPLGLTLEVDLGGNLFTVTGMVNLHNIDYTNSPGRDRGSVSLLFGMGI